MRICKVWKRVFGEWGWKQHLLWHPRCKSKKYVLKTSTGRTLHTPTLNLLAIQEILRRELAAQGYEGALPTLRYVEEEAS